MKPVTLCAALLFPFLCKAISPVNNLVVNGDFESADYVQSIPEGYTWAPWNAQLKLESCYGWIVDNTGDEWNGGIEIKSGEEFAGDGIDRPVTDVQFCHIWGYDDNGWDYINLAQAIHNLVIGRSYTLDFVLGVNWPEGARFTPLPDYGVGVYEPDFDSDGSPKPGKVIMEQRAFADTREMKYYSFGFVPGTSSVLLNFFLANHYGTGNLHPNLFMDVDMVRIYSQEGDEPGADVILTPAHTDATADVYSLSGTLLKEGCDKTMLRQLGPGAYIVRCGEEVIKLLVR